MGNSNIEVGESLTPKTEKYKSPSGVEEK